MTVPMIPQADSAAEARQIMRQQIAERERILAGQFFLVNIGSGAGSIGERLRCKNCGGHHRYLTLRCVERPFDGIEGGLFGYFQVMGSTGVVETLDPIQRAQYDRVAELLGSRDRDLSASHPLTARSLGVGARDEAKFAMAVGVLEPISRVAALERVRRINMRGNPFSLTGLKGGS